MADVLVSFRVPKAIYDRLSKHPAFPLKKKATKQIHDFYRSIFFDYVQSPAFKLAEAKAKLHDLEAQLRGAKPF